MDYDSTAESRLQGKPEITPRQRNPFHYLRPILPNQFLGRWPLVTEIARDVSLGEGDSHACVGGRRFGKSSLLLALQHELRQMRADIGDHLVLPIIFDFKGHNFVSERDFFAALLDQIQYRVDATVSNPSNDASPVRVTLDHARLTRFRTGEPTGLSLSQFEEALDYILDRLYRAGGPTCVAILLDEVDDALRYPWHTILFGQLRALIYSGDLRDRVRLVFAGSRRFLDEVTDHGSPLWNVLKLHYLSAFVPGQLVPLPVASTTRSKRTTYSFIKCVSSTIIHRCR